MGHWISLDSYTGLIVLNQFVNNIERIDWIDGQGRLKPTENLNFISSSYNLFSRRFVDVLEKSLVMPAKETKSVY